MTVRVKFPGLLKERLPSGRFRYRVRVEGQPAKRIRIHVDPDHPKFGEHYHAARAGIGLPPEEATEVAALRGSVGWLVDDHLTWLAREVRSGQRSRLTLKKREGLLSRFRAVDGAFNAAKVPTWRIIEIRDDMADTPAIADSMVEAIRVMYRWGMERGRVKHNPAIGIPKIDRGKGGAKPWKTADLAKFRRRHPAGTTPHLCLTLLMFTGCRIGDAIRLGRSNEFKRDGVTGIGWQPTKKGSAPVQIPMLPPLLEATRAQTVQGATYLLTAYGRSFATPDALGQNFRKWCDQAGLAGLSAHGVRKALAEILAEHGCSEHEIMSILAHTQPQTSAIYTKGARRWRMSVAAMERLRGMEW